MVFFVFALLRDGIYWIADWIVTRYHMMIFRLKDRRHRSWLSYFF